jgi:two-component system sensor histidine kinase HydH
MLFNILAGVFHIYSSNKALKIYKENLIELGLFLLKSFEMGNRIYMITQGDTNHSLMTFVEEFRDQKSIKNIVIYDGKKNVIASAYKDNIPYLKPDLKNIIIDFQNKEFVIYEPYAKTFETHGRRSGVMGGHRMEIRPSHLPYNELNIAISLNNEGYRILKRHFYNHLFVLSLILILITFVYFYMLRLIKLYRLSENMRKVAERDAELGKFSNLLAHEIKNPLSSIDGLIRYAAGITESANIKEYLIKSLEELKRINKLVNDFLYFGKEINFNKDNFDISEVINKAILLLTYEINQKKLHIDLMGPSFDIYADKDKILQVIMNLLLNGVQSAPPESHITLVYNSDKTLLITNNVERNNKIDKAKLFEPFYTTKITGSGLGLSISKKLMELQGFSITIISVEPFVVKLAFGDVCGQNINS